MDSRLPTSSSERNEYKNSDFPRTLAIQKEIDLKLIQEKKKELGYLQKHIAVKNAANKIEDSAKASGMITLSLEYRASETRGVVGRKVPRRRSRYLRVRTRTHRERRN